MVLTTFIYIVLFSENVRQHKLSQYPIFLGLCILINIFKHL